MENAPIEIRVPRIGIVIGSTRPGRKSGAIAEWILESSKLRSDATLELIDLRDFDLPLLDEPMSAKAVALAYGEYQHEHTRKWSAAIDGFDGFIFIAPEYNHGISGALKNALDFLYREWNNKASAIVTCGSNGGIRASEQLRSVLGELQVAAVRNEVNLSSRTDFKDFKEFVPAPIHAAQLSALLDQLVAWSRAMGSLRRPHSSA